VLTKEEIRGDLLGALRAILGGETEIAEHDNLIALGLESLPTMRLLAGWIKQGYHVSFGSFMRHPTVEEWATMLAEAAPHDTRDSGADPTSATDGPASGMVGAGLPAGDHEPFDLTDVQYAYWIGRGQGLRLGGVGTHGYVEVETGRLDVARLQDSWTAILRAHPMLRSCYTSDGKQYVLSEPVDATVEVHDLTGLDEPARQESLVAMRERLSHRLLAIDEGQVTSLQVSLLSEDRAIIHFDIDLLVCDVQSFQIILRDLAHHYVTGEAPDVDPSWSFARYLAREAREDTATFEQDQKYWRDRLADLPAGPRLPLRRAADAGRNPRFARRSHAFDMETWEALRQTCETHGTTPATVLLTAYARTVGQWSEDKRFLMAVPLFNRDPDPAIENVVADFTTLTLTSIDQTQPCAFLEDLRAVQDSFYEDVAHSRYSAVRVLRDLRTRRDEQVLTPVVFSCNLGSPLVNEEFIDAFGEISYMISQTPQVWIDLQVFSTIDGFMIICDALEQLFPEGLLDDFFGALVAEITAAATHDLALLGPVDSPGVVARREERAEVAAWQLPDTTLVAQVLAAAERFADRPALRTSDGQVITYQDLITRACAVATSLVAAGVTRGELTAVMAPRGPRQIIGALGVMMAGAAYVPISRQQPTARVTAILSSPRIGHLLTSEDSCAWAGANVQVVDFDRAWDGADGVTLPQLGPEDSAYVIYTSGTTGAPKGVEVCHGAVWNTIYEVNRRLGIGCEDKALGVSSFDFDLSVYDAFGLLAAGAELVTIPDEARRDAEAWLEMVGSAGITVWNSVPTLFEMLLASAGGDPARLASLRHVLLSGDWIDVGLPARMRAMMPQGHILAMGGATEAAIWSNAFDVPHEVPADWVSIPYGRPLARQAYRVVGPDGRDCPDHVAGELWIGGLGVATCYVDDPELSRQKFVSSEGSRWYRTGDMGRFWHDGTIEFLGRSDNQVKLRGHRIELGEIEAACEALLPVERAVCIAWQGQASKCLVAFVQFTPITALGGEASEWSDFDLISSIQPTLADEKLRAAVDQDDALQRSYALQTMRRWETDLSGANDREHLSGLRRKWRGWLADEKSGAEQLPGMAGVDQLHQFVAPFERAFVEATDAPTIAEFVQTPDFVPVEEFLASRPLGRYIHGALCEVVRGLAQAHKGAVRILEVGARRPKESADYRRVAAPSSYVLADQSRHHLDLAQQRVPGLFEQFQLGTSIGDQAPARQLLDRADLAVCNQTLHQSADIDATLREVRSLIKPRGLMILVEMTAASPLADVSAAFIAGGHRGFRAGTGEMLLSASQWNDALRRTGWNPLGCVEIVGSVTLVVAARSRADEPEPLPATEYDKAAGLLSTRLPEYMVPKRIVEISRFPLTGNGKVDRQALARMVPEEPGEDDGSSAPMTATEQQLAEIWDELLQTSSSVDSDYFRLGGDSLMATRLRQAIEERFQVGFSLDSVFDSPVLRDMAVKVDESASQAGRQVGLPPIRHGEDQFAPFPLTDVQQSYLIGGSGAVELGDVSSHCYFEMATPVLDPDRLEKSFNALVERHPMLRAVVCEDSLTQRILRQVPYYELAHLRGTAPDGDQRVAAARHEMSRQRFDPTQWPCFDVRYADRVDGGRLFLSFDNLFIDGWSMFHLFREWKQIYEHGIESLTDALPYSFKDYVEASVELRRGETHARDLAYWESSLESIHPAPQLPVSGPDLTGSSEFVRHEALVAAELWQAVTRRVRAEGLTDAVFLAEVYAEVLARYSEEPRLSINLTQFDRTRFAPEVDAIVGDFTSLSILSVDTRCAATFRDRAKALQRRMLSNLAHATVSGVAVERMLNKQRKVQVTMPVVFTCGLGVVEHANGDHSPYLGVIDYGLSQTPQVWMDLQVYEHRGGLMLNMDVVEAIIPAGMADEMFRALTVAIEHLAGDPDLWQSATTTVAPTFNDAATAELNDTDRVMPGEGQTLLDLYLAGARAHPDHVAVVDVSTSQTYSELDEESDRWANLVLAADPELGELVGILMGKSVHQISAVIGVLKAGCAYLPLSVAHPPARNLGIIRDSGAHVVLADDRGEVPNEVGRECTVVTTEDLPSAFVDDRDLAGTAPVLDGLAYVIYTSGTTGAPKGVAITHKAAVNTTLDVNARLHVQATDRVLALSQLNFDLSVYDMFGMFARGAALVLPSGEGQHDPEHWWEMVRTHRVTLWNSVPQFFSMYIGHLSDRGLVDRDIRAALLSGDWIPVDVAVRVEECFSCCAVHGAGGATEASIWSNWYDISKDDARKASVPYGRPLANQRMYVLDSSLDNRPDLVPGDLYIAGHGLATGYWNDPVKTAHSFMTHPRTGERLYRTGDQAMYGRDGNIIFLGRNDGQVKVNGYRIELGEIESVARGLPAVRDCVATIDRGIVLYVVANDGFTTERLAEHLASALPEYMRPRLTVVLDDLPRTWNGKIDRDRLRTVAAQVPVLVEGPRNERDTRILGILRSILNIEEIGIDDDFFGIGGDSLSAVHLANSIRREMSVQISIREVFGYPTVRQLSDHVADIVGADVDEGEV
jgi:amino acid adenylation domain-containing protein